MSAWADIQAVRSAVVRPLRGRAVIAWLTVSSVYHISSLYAHIIPNMIANTYERKLVELEDAALTLGGRLEQSLVGDRHPSNERIDEVYFTIYSTFASQT